MCAGRPLCGRWPLKGIALIDVGGAPRFGCRVDEPRPSAQAASAAKAEFRRSVIHAPRTTSMAAFVERGRAAAAAAWAAGRHHPQRTWLLPWRVSKSGREEILLKEAPSCGLRRPCLWGARQRDGGGGSLLALRRIGRSQYEDGFFFFFRVLEAKDKAAALLEANSRSPPATQGSSLASSWIPIALALVPGAPFAYWVQRKGPASICRP